MFAAMFTSALLLASAAAAQEYTGNVDPSAYSLPTVMHSAIDARARSAARRSTAPRRLSTRDSAATCANLPKARARLGARDWRVMRLANLCREAGLLH
jgi:hypothetical protein